MTLPGVFGRFRLQLASLACASIFLLSGLASGAEKCGSIDRVMVALRLIHVIYPDLTSREFSLQFAETGPLGSPTDVRMFVVAVDRPHWHQPGKLPPEISDIELPMYLHFDFIDNTSIGMDVVCRPMGFMNSTESKQRSETKRIINSHPEWSDAQYLEVARQHGMRFGPERKGAVLNIIQIKKLSEFYGPLRIKTVSFEIACTAIKEAGSSFADFSWSIYAEETGTKRQLGIGVDPFDGKIFNLGETDKFISH